jgi:hypothetical protein
MNISSRHLKNQVEQDIGLHSHHEHDHLEHFHHHHDIDLTHIKKNLRSSSLRIGKRRSLQSISGYSYQVDVYIEIDFDLCARHNESCTNGVGSKTLNYINVLFVGANSVYEVSSRYEEW